MHKESNVVEKWVCGELTFTAKEEVSDIADGDLVCVFSHESGKALKIYGFWNGKTEWRVRFALTEIGKWKWSVTSTENLGIEEEGELECVPYEGDLDVYKHGFVKTEPNKKYFVYDDGTPFFYLGDTHWTAFIEPMSEETKGKVMPYKKDGNYRFQACLNQRVKQGYNVYQTQPLGLSDYYNYHPENGVDASVIKVLKKVDKYFDGIAKSGVTHANSQWIFPADMKNKIKDPAYMKIMAKHWVARYGAYPVMWTMGQTVDRQGYKHYGFDESNNPYHLMCQYVHEFDPYQHPLTAHQENALFTGVKGEVTDTNDILGRHPSSFDKIEGHNWFAVQWKPNIAGIYNVNIPKDYYYNSNKPAVNYEGYYNMLGGKDNACRMQAWLSIMSGFCGYGYGTQGTWCIGSGYMIDQMSFDGLEVVTPQDKHIEWDKAFDLPGATQVALMAQFFRSFKWWELKPDLNGDMLKKDKEDLAVLSHINQDIVLVYIYSLKRQVKSWIEGLSHDPYHAQWYNPITNQMLDAGFVQMTDNRFYIEQKPAECDLLLVLTRQTDGTLNL